MVLENILRIEQIVILDDAVVAGAHLHITHLEINACSKQIPRCSFVPKLRNRLLINNNSIYQDGKLL
jgi:hypothetical protein